MPGALPRSGVGPIPLGQDEDRLRAAREKKADACSAHDAEECRKMPTPVDSLGHFIAGNHRMSAQAKQNFARAMEATEANYPELHDAIIASIVAIQKKETDTAQHGSTPPSPTGDATDASNCDMPEAMAADIATKDATHVAKHAATGDKCEERAEGTPITPVSHAPPFSTGQSDAAGPGSSNTNAVQTPQEGDGDERPLPTRAPRAFGPPPTRNEAPTPQVSRWSEPVCPKCWGIEVPERKVRNLACNCGEAAQRKDEDTHRAYMKSQMRSAAAAALVVARNLSVQIEGQANVGPPLAGHRSNPTTQVQGKSPSTHLPRAGSRGDSGSQSSGSSGQDRCSEQNSFLSNEEIVNTLRAYKKKSAALGPTKIRQAH